MQKKEYIVGIKRHIDYDSVWNRIESNNDLEISDERIGSKRLCHYLLTEDQVNTLRNDPDIETVEIPPSQREDIICGLHAIQTSNFNKPKLVSQNSIEWKQNFVNWGLARSAVEQNIDAYEYSLDTSNGVEQIYTQNGATFNLDGEGVDIVIQDSGIDPDHPEFWDENGVSRVQKINWYEAAGLPFQAQDSTPPAEIGERPKECWNYYYDGDGHGTHVAAIAAGRMYGWAKKAKIYSQKLAGLKNSGYWNDYSIGTPESTAFDLIRLWHQNKPIDPRTGYKRPTIVNMSWGYSSWYQVSHVTAGNIKIVSRGITYSETQTNSQDKIYDLGLLPLTDGVYNYVPVRVASIDIEIQEMIDAGIHVVIAGGNDYFMGDIISGPDYNNYYTIINPNIIINGVPQESSPVYYNRGSSPYSPDAITVGNLDSVRYNVGTVSEPIYTEVKARSSRCGPIVDIWAPGTNIMSALSFSNSFWVDVEEDAPKYEFIPSDYTVPKGGENTTILTNWSYWPKKGILSGTSMAAPQVTGFLSYYLQVNPNATPEQAKAYLKTRAVTTNQIYDDGLLTNYRNLYNLKGAPNSIMYNIDYNSATQFKLEQ